ncbi:MAG: carboxypeptidase regulatory-like domain-containing protein [Candidatus Rokubacteria bacterium]|nr:carboxypeptidase regulatory-like domain-containing protein [Candidatus Rokubacteria bacterium]
MNRPSRPATLVAVLLVALMTGACGDAARGGGRAGATGVLVGRVTAGPTSPVVTPGSPGTPQPAAGITLAIARPDGTRVTTVTTAADGTYQVTLPPGSYEVSAAALPPMAFTKQLPRTVTIREGAETRLDVSIDTGIR